MIVVDRQICQCYLSGDVDHMIELICQFTDLSNVSVI